MVFMEMCGKIYPNLHPNPSIYKLQPGASQLFEKHKKVQCAVVRRFTCSKIRTTEPSNNWDVPLVRRFTCSKVHLFEGSLVRIFEQLKLRTNGASQLFEASLVRKVKNVKCAVVRRPSCSKYSP